MSSASSGPIRAVAKFFFEGDRKFFVKGVTYGPFKPDAEGHYLGPPEQVQRDLAQMREIGINLVRIYHVPPRLVSGCCAARACACSSRCRGRNTLSFLPEGSAR